MTQQNAQDAALPPAARLAEARALLAEVRYANVLDRDLCDRIDAFLAPRDRADAGKDLERRGAGASPGEEGKDRETASLPSSHAAPLSAGGRATRPTRVRLIPNGAGRAWMKPLEREVRAWVTESPQVETLTGGVETLRPGEWEPADAPAPPPPDLAAMREAESAFLRALAERHDAERLLAVYASACNRKERERVEAAKKRVDDTARALLSARAEPGREVAGCVGPSRRGAP